MYPIIQPFLVAYKVNLPLNNHRYPYYPHMIGFTRYYFPLYPRYGISLLMVNLIYPLKKYKSQVCWLNSYDSLVYINLQVISWVYSLQFHAIPSYLYDIPIYYWVYHITNARQLCRCWSPHLLLSIQLILVNDGLTH